MPKPSDNDRLDAILADVAAGIPVRQTLKTNGLNPKDFYGRLTTDDALGKRYARAKDAGMDAIADDAIEISDNCVADRDAVAKARLQVDSRKWFLSKLAPKKYGDRTIIAGDADNPLAIAVDDAETVLLGRLGALADEDGDSPASGETVQ